MSRRLKFWGIGVLAVAIVAVTVIPLFLRWADSGSDGTVHTGMPVATTSPPPSIPLILDTSYFTAKLPPGFAIKRQETSPTAGILLQLVATNAHQQFAVTVGTLPSEGLTGVGDYNLRVTKTTDYESYRPAGMPVEATAFRNTTGRPAFAAFWPHGSQYTEIALSSDGGDSTPQLFDTFEIATHAWQWK